MSPCGPTARSGWACRAGWLNAMKKRAVIAASMRVCRRMCRRRLIRWRPRLTGVTRGRRCGGRPRVGVGRMWRRVRRVLLRRLRMRRRGIPARAGVLVRRRRGPARRSRRSRCCARVLRHRRDKRRCPRKSRARIRLRGCPLSRLRRRDGCASKGRRDRRRVRRGWLVLPDWPVLRVRLARRDWLVPQVWPVLRAPRMPAVWPALPVWRAPQVWQVPQALLPLKPAPRELPRP